MKAFFTITRGDYDPAILTLLIFCASLLFPKIGFSQQPQVYDQFFMNPYVYNPAYAGVEGHAAVFFAYHDQWTNNPEAPQTAHASFHIPLRGGIAFGAAAFNIQQGLLNTSAAKITGAYLINIDRTHFLRFGMSMGAGINSVNITEFDAPNDPAFTDFLDQSSFLIGDVGFTYHFGHFNVGASLPNLFQYNPVSQTEFSEVGFSPTDNILFKMNYRGHISDDFAVEPHVLYRYNNLLPSQYEAILIGHIKHVVWAGAGYRQDAGAIGLVGAKVKEKIAIGFAYEPGGSDIASEVGPTFEMNIGYHLGTKKEHAEHVSSFIKSHRLTAEERAKKAELERQKQLTNQENGNIPASEDQLGIVGETAAVSAVVAGTGTGKKTEDQPKEDLSENEDYGTEIQDPTNQNESIVEEIAIASGQKPSNTEEIEKGDPSLTNDFRTNEEISKSDEPLKVKRGNHLLELPTGNFVVGGAFNEFQHAEEFSDRLFQAGFHDTIVGYSTARGYYYVVVFQSDNLSLTRQKRDQLRKTQILKNAWVLQVNE